MDKKEEKKVSAEPKISVLRERLRACYPDESPLDDEAWDGLGVRYIDETSSAMERYSRIENCLSELCRAYPEFAELVFNLVEHKMPLRVAIARTFAQEDLIPQEGDDDFEGYREAFRSRLDAAKRREQQGREIDDNERKSVEAIDAFCGGKGMSDEQKDALVELINNHFTELLYKRISPEMLEGFLKQMSFDEAVADASRTGEIRGRNTAIEARRMKERQAVAGDGLPGSIGGGSIEQRPRSLREFLGESGNRTNYSELLNKRK